MPAGARPFWNPERGHSARKLLTIDWDFPVYDPAQRTRRTVALPAREALPSEKAFTELAGDDPRPLLVLRECLACSGTDDALLSRQDDNERTVLMSSWFHCVKLPPDVLDEKHAFRGLFPGDDPAHLFVSRRNGDLRADLVGDQSRTELWKVMEGVLREEYNRRPDRALKELFRLLERYDSLDSRQVQLESQLEEKIEKSGPDSSKVARLRRDIDKVKKQRQELVEAWEEAMELELRNPLPETPAEAAAAGKDAGVAPG